MLRAKRSFLRDTSAPPLRALEEETAALSERIVCCHCTRVSVQDAMDFDFGLPVSCCPGNRLWRLLYKSFGQLRAFQIFCLEPPLPGARTQQMRTGPPLGGRPVLFATRTSSVSDPNGLSTSLRRDARAFSLDQF